MSEHLTIAKSRKKFTLTVNEGDYFLLVQPGKPYDEHIKAYRKCAEGHPVSEEYNRVVLGQLRHLNPPLSFITKAQKVVADDDEQKRNDSIEQTVMTARDRQNQMEQNRKDALADSHAKQLEKKNALINEVRKSTGQTEIKPETKKVAETPAAETNKPTEIKPETK